MKFAFLLGIKFWLSTLSKVQIFFRREERGGSLTLIRNQHWYNPNSFAAQSIDQMCYSILTADSNWDIAVARAARKQLDLALAVHVCHPVTCVARLRSSGITLFRWEVPRHLVHTKALRNKFNIWSLFRFTQNHNRSWVSRYICIYIYIYIYPMSSEKSLLQEIECAFDEHLALSPGSSFPEMMTAGMHYRAVENCFWLTSCMPLPPYFSKEPQAKTCSADKKRMHLQTCHMLQYLIFCMLHTCKHVGTHNKQSKRHTSQKKRKKQMVCRTLSHKDPNLLRHGHTLSAVRLHSLWVATFAGCLRQRCGGGPGNACLHKLRRQLD